MTVASAFDNSIISSRVVLRFGSPAVMKGIKPFLPALLNTSKLSLIRLKSFSSVFSLGLLLANNFYHDSLASATIKLAVENLFPWSKIKPAGGNRNNDFPTHYLSLVMRVAIIFAGAVVMITLWAGIERRQPFKPALVVLVQAGFVIINKHARCYMHGVN